MDNLSHDVELETRMSFVSAIIKFKISSYLHACAIIML